MNKIKIKLKECCLTCEHFDSSGIIGLSLYASCCGGLERVIACGHMDVCYKYQGYDVGNASMRGGGVEINAKTGTVCTRIHC